MCHVVAGYPDDETCLQLILGMAQAGVTAIEVQVPFSDPIADGETIMEANDTALEQGMTTAGSFELIQKTRVQGVKSDIFIMSYLQKVQHFGIKEFCEAAVKSDADGLIIPDLPYDSPEYAQLIEHTKAKLQLIPVLSPGMPEQRLKALLQSKPSRVYVTSQRGITGNAYSGGEALKQLVADIRTQSKALIMIGFGIADAQDVTDALEVGDIAVVGSAIVRQLRSSGPESTVEYVEGLMKGHA
jgi:tryptophan synthase alpha chain